MIAAASRSASRSPAGGVPVWCCRCVSAVLHAGYPSVQVLGVADLLFGIVSPAARLTATMLPANFVNEVAASSPPQLANE